MPFDVFISYSHKDQSIADELCTVVEATGLQCWIASRDIPVGADWSESIVESIDRCRTLVVLLSSNSTSNQILREVQHAFNNRSHIVPVRIEAVEPPKSLAFSIQNLQRLEALDEPREEAFRRLAKHLQTLAKQPSNPPVLLSNQQLSATMSNPHYEQDLINLDRDFEVRNVINRRSISIVVGSSIPAELFDRSVAEFLRDEIDKRGSGRSHYHRAIVVSDCTWQNDAYALADKAVIAIGSPKVNQISKEFEEKGEGKYEIAGTTEKALVGFFRKTTDGRPQAALWGTTATGTREAVEHYLRDPHGLREFLEIVWV